MFLVRRRKRNLARDFTAQGSNPGRVTKFFSSPKPPDQLWGHLASYLLGTGIISQGIKSPGNEIDH
jgi:hypothetical protein